MYVQVCPVVLLYALLHRRKLHIVVEEMPQILIIALRKQHGSIFKRKLLPLAEPRLREHLPMTIRTCIHLHVLSLVVVIQMAQPVHLPYQMAAHGRAAEESKGLYGEASPLLLLL